MTDTHIALCSGGTDSVAATHASMVFGPAEQVVYLDTGTGLQDNVDYVRDLCQQFGWPIRVIETPESYEELVADHGYPGPSRHFIMYQRLKERQLCTLAAETDGDLHLWTGIRRAESDRRMRHVEAETERGDGRWYWRAPLCDWPNGRPMEYIEQFDLLKNPLWESIGRSGDCFCGCFGDRAELIDLAAAGFEEHANWLDSIETPDGCPREQQRWAGYNWEKHDWAADDELQTTLCSSCAVPDGGEPSNETSSDYSDSRS